MTLVDGAKIALITVPRKVFRIGTVRYHWPMSAHASQAFSIASCTDSEDLPSATAQMYSARGYGVHSQMIDCCTLAHYGLTES